MRTGRPGPELAGAGPSLRRAAALGVAGLAVRLWRARRQLEAGRAALESDPELAVPTSSAHRSLSTDDGAEIHVVEGGRGQPVVLVHGFMLSSAIWSYQLRDLADSRRVLAVDQRGHGESRGGAEPYSINRLGTDLAEMLESLDLERAVVVGHSMGGMAALAMMIDHGGQIGHRVAGLVLVATSGGPLSRLPGWPWLVRAVGAASRGDGHDRADGAKRTKGIDAPSKELRRGWPAVPAYMGTRFGLGANATPAHVEATRALVGSASREVRSGLVNPVLSFNVSKSLEKVDVPTLVVVGSRDRLTPPWNAAHLVRALPRAQLLTFAGCGHMVMLERRWELDGALERFADICQAARPGSPT